MSEERIIILQMLHDAKITVEEAEKLLAAIESGKNGISDKEESTKQEKREHKNKSNSWDELGEKWEQFGNEMETFWKDFGFTLKENIGPNWSKKLENWADNFGKSLKNISKDLNSIAGEAAQQFFDQLGVDAHSFGTKENYKVTVEETWEWKTESEDIEEILLSNNRGDITCMGTEDNTINIIATKTAAGADEEKARELLAKIEIEPKTEEKILKIEVEKQKIPHSRLIEIDYKLYIPKKLKIEIKSLRGDISVKETSNTLKVLCKNGDINFTRVKGEKSVQLSKGDLSVSECEGQLSLQISKGDCDINNYEGDCSSNILKGDLSIKNLKGNVNGKIALGDISIRELTGFASIVAGKGDVSIQTDKCKGLDVTTHNGDQSYELTNLIEGNYNIVCHHGDVSVIVKESISADCNFQILKGDFESNLIDLEHDYSPHSITQKIGEGAAKVEVNIVKGDLSLLQK